MPNRWTRNASDTLVPKVGGTKPDGTISNSKIESSTIEAGKISYFKSASTTGTGGAQNIAHGLGRVPALVIVIPQTNSATNVSIIEGTHTSTNVVVTVPNTTTFRVVAL